MTPSTVEIPFDRLGSSFGAVSSGPPDETFGGKEVQPPEEVRSTRPSLSSSSSPAPSASSAAVTAVFDQQQLSGRGDLS